MTDRMSPALMRDLAQPVVVPGNRVIRSTELAHVGGPHLATHTDMPKVDLVIEANIVRAIDVTCSCGKKFRIWCSYETPQKEHDSAHAA